MRISGSGIMRRRSGGAPAAHSGEGGETVGTEVDGGEDGALVVSGPQARTVVMGILNVTPDSFSDGNKFFDPAAAVGRMLALEAAGVDVIDIGGQSTRPNAHVIEAELEAARVVPVIEAARKAGVKAPISIDTFRASVARAAVAAGADMINDVSGGLLDDEMLRTAADLGVPICLMHYRGDPSTMVCRLSLPSRPNP